MGALSDRLGRMPVLCVFSSLVALTGYPVMMWLVADPSLPGMLTTLLWLSFLYGGYQGVMVVTLTEVMPAKVRATGFALAYSIAQAIFGGFTPAICTWLISASGDKAIPGPVAVCVRARRARRRLRGASLRAASPGRTDQDRDERGCAGLDELSFTP
ncbi:hypothetical protein MU582_13665 [Nocardioidaceae bacterium SCSIO 66511]|nr:hypothetical protein MU582_13665 [Nocardioidaceae bacterium SCSIO 66511]